MWGGGEGEREGGGREGEGGEEVEREGGGEREEGRVGNIVQHYRKKHTLKLCLAVIAIPEKNF